MPPSKLPVLLTILIALSGCATTSTLSQPVHERRPLVMSGVRLDLASLRQDAGVTERFGVSPPDYPLLDLPFSALFDIFALGYTVPVALFRATFSNFESPRMRTKQATTFTIQTSAIWHSERN